MTVISAQRRGSLLGVVDRYWRNSGYRMRTVNNHVDAPAMYAETKDGFAVSLIVADKGQVHFDVNSPCVSYSEVADSPRQATAPLDPEAEVIPRPNIHSDFWSAQTPEVGVTVGGD
ncbi:Lipoprotein OS=Streptomyces microflavus OX=1919 GN=G3I39_12555 PE=4 SV=1 [Streptomyces microflavus]